MSSMPPETTSALPAEPVSAEVLGLRAAELAARVRQALYRTPPSDLAEAYRRMREGAMARHLDYFMDGAVQTIRVFPCPITLLPEQVDYVHRRRAHPPRRDAPHARPLPRGSGVRAILRLEPVEDSLAPRLLAPGRCKAEIPCSAGWTRWWTTPAPSGRTRSSSSSPT